MSGKVAFWTWALANMVVIVALALAGIRARQQGDVPRHRRLMLAAAALIGFFLGAYVLKLVFLGREDMASWSTLHVWVLRVHELCVLTMLLAGGLALRRGSALRTTRNATRDPNDPPAEPAQARGHRGAGKLAVGAAVLGLLTAAVVLAGMYERAGLL